MLKYLGNVATVFFALFTAVSVFIYVEKMPPLELGFVPWQTLLFLGYIGTPILLITFCSNRFVKWGARLTLSLMLLLYLTSMWIQLVSFSFLGHLVDLNYLITNWIVLKASMRWFMMPSIFVFFALSTTAVYFSVFFKSWVVNHIRFRIGAIAVLLLAALLAVGVVPQRLERLPWDPVLALLGVGSPINFAKNSLELNEHEIESRENWSPSPILDEKPNIILFMADSVNVNHLSVFGYERETTPFLSGLGDLYPNIAIQTGRATCPDSICGVMSTLLSRRFVDTPTRDHFGLGQVLSRLGYDVKFVLVSDHNAHFYRPYVHMLDSESDEIFDYRDTDTPLNSDTLALEGMHALPDYSDKPTFIFVFFFSAHLAGENMPEFAVFGDFLADRSYWIRKNGVFDDEDLLAITNHYDNKLIQLDHFVMNSWEILQDKGYTQNSTFLFVADHGEALGDRGKIGHSIFEEETLRIPFIAASTNREIELDWANPEQVDIAPTVLSMLGQRSPENWRGSDLTNQQKGPYAYHETGMRKFHTGENCIGVFAPKWGSNSDLRVEACYGDSGGVNFSVTEIEDDQTYNYVDWSTLDGSVKAEFQELLRRAFPRSEVVRRFENIYPDPSTP